MIPIKIQAINDNVIVEYTVPKEIRDKVYPVNEQGVYTISDEFIKATGFKTGMSFQDAIKESYFMDTLIARLSNEANLFEEFRVPKIISCEDKSIEGHQAVLKIAPGKHAFQGAKRFSDLENHKIYAMIQLKDIKAIKKLDQVTPISNNVVLKVKMPETLIHVIKNSEDENGDNVLMIKNEEQYHINMPIFNKLYGQWNADQGFAVVHLTGEDSRFNKGQEVVISSDASYQMQYAYDIDFINFEVYFIVQESTIKGIVQTDE